MNKNLSVKNTNSGVNTTAIHLKMAAILVKTICLFLVCGVAFISCDIVEEPFKKDWTPPDPEETTPKILLEEFTGHKCNNCPAAHQTAYQLANMYPDKFIVVAMHVGSFARPESTGEQYRYDFRTTVGSQISTYYNAEAVGLPCGMINRTLFNDQMIIRHENWGFATNAFLENNKTAEVKIELYASYNSATRQIEANVKLDYLSPQTNTNQMSVWIVEDSIINWQMDGTKEPPNIPDYVHNNVLRYSFNGTWGEVVSDAAIIVGSTFDNTYSYTLPSGSDWKPENLKIIAFVYDEENGVKQVERIKLTIND